MLSVLKLGGSVLRDAPSYATAARFLAGRLAARPDERLVVIVSAPFGMTDALLAEAETIIEGPGNEALDLLWSTGEQRSVALLSLHLQALGIASVPFNVHQTGLVAERTTSTRFEPSSMARFEPSSATRFETSSTGTRATAFRPLRLLAALGRSRIVIVPGFLGVSAGGTVTSLGRGGSDLTAVLLAAGIRANVCELIKDVPGYFTADPHVQADARPIHDLTIDEALRMADAGCDLVQRAALAAAAAAGLQLVIRSLDAAGPVTHVRSTNNGIRHQVHSRRPAVGA